MAETLVNKNQEGEGIWTSDNLVAGSGISISQVPQPVIDENTVELLHLNDNTTDEISNTDVYSSGGTLSYSDGKFGKCLSVSGSQATFTNQTDFKPGSDSYTIDYWFRGNSSISYPYPGVQLQSTNTNGQIYFTSTTSMTMGPQLTGSGSSKTFTIPSVAGKWVHIAYVHNLGDKDYLFLNGSLLESWTRTYNYNGIGFLGVLAGSAVDEVRVSNVARWTSDFTPFTVPYAASSGPTQYAINNTKADPDLSSYLQNTATGTNSLTIDGVAASASQSLNFGDNSQAIGGQSIAIGSGTTTSNAAYANTNCVAIGFAARANYGSGTAIGRESQTTGNNGVAVGYESTATTGAVAVGKTAKATANEAIQIGTGTNSTAGTVQIKGTRVLDANGKIPTASLEADLTTKADTDLSNVTKPYVTETYVNSASWYRVWSDGWCEQGGQKGAFVTTISFLKSFADTNYYFNEKCYRTGSTEAAYNYYTSKTMNSITILQNDEPGFWYACGYISQE